MTTKKTKTKKKTTTTKARPRRTTHEDRIADRQARRAGQGRHPVTIGVGDHTVTTAPLEHPLSEEDRAYVDRLREELRAKVEAD